MVPDFPGVKTREGAMSLLAKYVKQATKPDQTILTWGYNVVAMGGDPADPRGPRQNLEDAADHRLGRLGALCFCQQRRDSEIRHH